MGKEQIRNQIAYYRSQQRVVGDKLDRLQAARRQLQGITPKVSYTLGSYEDIKGKHLAGTPYREMTEDEKGLIKEASRYFQTQKEFFLDELNRHITRHENTLDSYRRSIESLSYMLWTMED